MTFNRTINNMNYKQYYMDISEYIDVIGKAIFVYDERGCYNALE